MIEYISGKIAELTPTTVTIDNNGIGNFMEISLQTYSKLDGKTDPEGIRTDALIDNDWMASIQLSVTFDFKERCIECHNQKNQMRK